MHAGNKSKKKKSVVRSIKKFATGKGEGKRSSWTCFFFFRCTRRKGKGKEEEEEETMQALVVVILLVVAAVAATGPGKPLFISDYLPDQPEVARNLSQVFGIGNYESYSGFITVNETTNSNMFFWFFPGVFDIKSFLLTNFFLHSQRKMTLRTLRFCCGSKV